ncbi:MAG TPA: ubiquitin-like small modifier protein 1 [Candidatus Limnocylindria bacterium]|nr:ubiquitin-like small modifier protein 1 [Candidatus Limnocylindria bacterium]
MPRVTVLLYGAYAEFAGGKKAVIDAANVREALDAAVAAYPALRERLRDEHGAIRQHVNVFANTEEMRHLDGEQTALRDGDVVHIIPAVSGGI